jgi:hypothetical protein
MRVDSGTLRLDGDIIRYRSSTFGSWEARLADIRIIGESTDECGPRVDDYWFCFAADAGGWLEASFYAEGRDTFLRALAERLGDGGEGGEGGVSIEPQLYASTTFASRVLWPPALRGRPMFTYTDIVLPWYRRLWTAPRNVQSFTEEVRSFLAVEGSADPVAPE